MGFVPGLAGRTSRSSPCAKNQQAIWLYVRFTLSFRDVEDLLAERGILVSYETVRRWVNHFGPKIAADLRKRRPKPHTIWHLDEVYLKIDGRLVYLWRAQQSSGEFASANPTKGDEDARVQEREIRAKISLNPRSHLQHIQRPTPSHVSKNTPNLQGVGRAHVA
jgi:hypothetical protein